ncbi:MAG: ornithine cyclodeaminase family protein [Chloroflexi bacterium]|nr:ornithine cyclodeaminase family protein [Chloroflexota bacterium]MBU1746519.1 ornithine cyclodeaminase family protein [Chloroflexota bacterium]MBU1879496.1 ornithine cyclodeaminase family protein [Chloroflexota bacterium]
MTDIEFLYLSQADVRATGIDMATAMDAVEDSFRLHHQGQAILPHKTVLDLDERERGRGNAMPAYVAGEYEVFGIKWIAGFPKNPIRYGLPRATGLFILNDSWKGIPLAIMDCTLLSAMRTGAVTGVAARYLARPDAESVAMIGAGVQARTQLQALQIACPGLRQVRAFDVRRETADQYAAEMNRQLALDVRAVDSPEAAVRDADIIVTVTVADEPIVKDAWVKPGSLFAAVGSYQEEEFAVVQRSDKVVVDSLEAVLHRGTPVIALMIDQGLIEPARITELGAIVCGDAPGRETPGERIFFSPIGMGTEDVCVCYKTYQLAIERGIGTRLGLFGPAAQ